MKKLFLFGLLFIVFNGTVALAQINCSDATGHVRYNEAGYAKGVAPRPGDVLSVSQVLEDGKIVSETTTFEGLPSRVGPIAAQFSEIKILSQTTKGPAYLKDYSAKLTLTAAAVFPSIPGLDLPLVEYVICHEVFEAFP